VIGDHARRWWVNPHPHRLAIDFDGVAKLDALANVGGLTIDGNPAFQNQLLHLQPRTQPRLSEHLVQLGRLRLRRQDPFGQLERLIFLIGIELASDHVFESGQRRLRRWGALARALYGYGFSVVFSRFQRQVRYYFDSWLRRYILG